MWKNSCFSDFKTFAEEVEIDLRGIRQIFRERLIISLQIAKVCPFSQLHQKHWTGFEVPELQVHCEVDCIAEQLNELQS